VNAFDVAVIGAGPAGAACAALCAARGWRTLVLERAIFPREKVCGDCLNPACWPVLDRLGVSERVRALPHARIGAVEFVGVDERRLRYPLPAGAAGEIAVKRSAFDQVLIERAVELGADVRFGYAVTKITPGWRVQTGDEEFTARWLVAADGRNSTVARLLGVAPSAQRDRIGLQAHLPAPAGFGEKVAMHLLAPGYCGVASVGGGEINLCLVAQPAHLPELKRWAAAQFVFPKNQVWRTMTPVSRAPVPPVGDRLLFAGDAARVVEPFTGEGIYYALASGALAADQLLRGDAVGYAAAHRALYRGRLWVNRLAKAAVLHPRLTTRLLAVAQRWPESLRLLTAKVVGNGDSARCA
jgi:geranylgeranyl reductase family protein